MVCVAVHTAVFIFVTAGWFVFFTNTESGVPSITGYAAAGLIFSVATAGSGHLIAAGTGIFIRAVTSWSC